MRYSLISFKANGEQVEHAGQQAAFFGLVVNGEILEYFTTIQALHVAVENLKGMEREVTAQTETIKFQLAA